MGTSLIKTTTITVTLLIAVVASAQVSTPIRYNEGPGVKLTDSLVLHPGLSVEGRYDSNVLFTDNSRQSAPYMRLIGHLHLATLSPQRLTDGDGQVAHQAFQFRLQAAAAYREYLSGDDPVTNQRAVELDGALNLKYSPTGAFALELSDDYERQVTARNFAIVAGATGLPSDTLSRDVNRLTARGTLAPGGGRLSIAIGYSLLFDAFEDEGFGFANKLAHELSVNGKYLLLPKTAILLDVVQRFYDYYNSQPAGGGNVDSTPLRVTAGLAGLITPRLSAILKVGYGNGFYKLDTDSFSSVLALAQLSYLFAPTATVKVGYERSFDDSTFANFFSDHRAFAAYDHLIAQRFILHLSLEYRFRQYGGFEQLGGVTALDMHLVTGALGFDYQIQEWLYIGVGYDLQVQDIATGPATSGPTIGLTNYVRHQAYGKVGFSY